MRLLLIRHGETQSNVDRLLDTAHPGAPLTQRGHEQAALLTESLAHENVDAIFTSTLTRAQQTAAPLAEKRQLPATVVNGVQEIAAGVEEMSADWTAYVEVLGSWSPTNMDVGLEGGETANEFLARFNAAVAGIEAQGHDSVALVSHGAALRVWALAQDPSVPEEFSGLLHNTEWIVVNGSSASGWKVERWGQHHLSEQTNTA